MDYTIIAPNAITGKAWGLDFIEGVAHTDNKALAGKLEHRGYKVTEAGAATGRIPCPHCEKDYASQQSLDTHIKEKHPEAVQK